MLVPFMRFNVLPPSLLRKNHVRLPFVNLEYFVPYLCVLMEVMVIYLLKHHSRYLRGVRHLNAN